MTRLAIAIDYVRGQQSAVSCIGMDLR